MAGPDPALYASAVLKGIGAPVTAGNIAGFIGWATAEGPLASSNWQRNNPLNTTESSGAVGGAFNSAGVRAYPDFNTGVRATVKTLLNGRYGGIIGAFKSNNPRGLGAAIGASPWGTSGSLVSQTVAAALGHGYQVPTGAGGTGASGSSAATLKGVGVKTAPTAQTSVVPGVAPTYQVGPNPFAALSGLEAARQQLNAKPGAPPAPSVLQGGWDELAAMWSGQQADKAAAFNAAHANQNNVTVTSLVGHAAANSSPLGVGGPGSPTGVGKGSYAGLVSPFAHKYSANLSNTDMGVDFGMQVGIRPGHPILAIGDSTYEGQNTFYQGQPVLWFKFSPQLQRSTGHWGYYISEEINARTFQVGQFVRAGTPLATFKSTGTGIELGWAGGVGQTEAQLHYPGEVGNRHNGNGTTPGRSYLAFLQHVGAI